MRDVFPPEKHAIAVYPLNNWGGLETMERFRKRMYVPNSIESVEIVDSKENGD